VVVGVLGGVARGVVGGAGGGRVGGGGGGVGGGGGGFCLYSKLGEIKNNYSLHTYQVSLSLTLLNRLYMPSFYDFNHFCLSLADWLNTHYFRLIWTVTSHDLLTSKVSRRSGTSFSS